MSEIERCALNADSMLPAPRDQTEEWEICKVLEVAIFLL